MKSVVVFLIGMALGGALVYTSLKYHVVRADDGLHMVPKMTGQFTETYVDIRGFGVEDWAQHRALAVALVDAKKHQLLAESAGGEQFLNSARGVLEMLRGGQPAAAD